MAAFQLIELACCPDRSKLCARCRDGELAQLAGVAACRGEVWARSLAKTIDRSIPWPSGSDKVMLIARMKVQDLARDAELLEVLAERVAYWAERWWSTPATV